MFYSSHLHLLTKSFWDSPGSKIMIHIYIMDQTENSLNGPLNTKTNVFNVPCHNTSSESPEPSIMVPIPQKYNHLKEVFSYHIAHGTVQSNTTLPTGRIYPLSAPKTRAIEEYIEEALSASFIQPSDSLAASGFSFVEKKDSGFRPCIDYQGLNYWDRGFY